jgi:hypothetical protein
MAASFQCFRGGLEAVNLSESEAGGSKCLPLLFLGLGIVLVVDWHGLLLYNRVARGALMWRRQK